MGALSEGCDVKTLHGLTSVLFAEDEYLIAELVTEALASQNWRVVGPFATVSSALAALDEGQRVDVAVLDVSLNGEAVYPLADRLMQDETPVILTTGCDVMAVPQPYSRLKTLSKPMEFEVLIDNIKQTLGLPQSGTL